MMARPMGPIKRVGGAALVLLLAVMLQGSGPAHAGEPGQPSIQPVATPGWEVYKRTDFTLTTWPRRQFAQGVPEVEDDSDLFPDPEDFGVAEVHDPLEPFNRFVFAINETIDIFLLQPVAATYRFLLPEVVRDSVRNATRNLNSPVVFANELFQGKTDRASDTVVRFAINSTVGVLGLFDFATDWGYPHYDEDFGQTLGVYGAGPGAYLVLPILGPSNIRDGIGTGVDALLDPWFYVLGATTDLSSSERRAIDIGRAGLEGVDLRSRNIENIDDLRRDSLDFYARIRSLYNQNRENKIRSAQPPGNPPETKSELTVQESAIRSR